MESKTIPQWWPKHEAIYDINKSYLDNAEHGPFFQNQSIPTRSFPAKDKWLEFLGHKIATPVGVPAGPLLNARWIDAAAKLGFDVLTYKTIRSVEFAGHPVPNMIYVDIKEGEEEILAQKKEKIVFSTDSIPQQMKNLAVTNSFGMPSRTPQYLKEDIPKAQASLKEGQMMIVSVVGSAPSEVCLPNQTKSVAPSENGNEFVRDFVDVAAFAKECGATAIEANFSCPNVATGEGQIYQNPKSVLDIASSIKKAIGDTPFIIKVGNYDDKDVMRKVFSAAQEAGVNCICGLNSVSMKVLSPKTNEPALGPKRLASGVCGGPIRKMAVNFIKDARKVINEDQLSLKLIGCGGITLPEHFDEFLDAGAEIATTATGMMWDPLLGLRWQASKGF